jgi:hypothetical protein
MKLFPISEALGRDGRAHLEVEKEEEEEKEEEVIASDHVR